MKLECVFNQCAHLVDVIILFLCTFTNLGAFNDTMGFPGSSMVRNPPADAGDTGDAGLIPGSGRSPEEEMATHSSILAWRIPWTEEPGGLQSMGSERVGHGSMHKLNDSMTDTEWGFSD